MSILARYKKPGGFKQLLQLIETSQPMKQEKLLEVVEKEDPSWAQKIREKKISPEMVLEWEHDHLSLIFENMISQHCSNIFKSMGEEKIKEFSTLLRADKYRELKQLVDDSSEPSPSQLAAAYSNMLETVRYLDEEKIIDLRYIDPVLDLGEAV